MSANMFLQNPEPQPNSTQASVPELPKNTSKLQDFTNNNLQKISESNNSKKTNEHTPQKTNESRIPVPASPVLLRRQYSLRLKGEKASGIIGNRRFSLLQEDKIQNDENSKGKQTEISGKAVSNQQLHRGRSFTDRRENTNERSQIHNRKCSTPNASMQANSSNSNKSYTNSSQRLRSLSMSSSTTRTYSSRSPKICTSSPNNSTSADNRHNFSTDNLDALNWDNESITSIGSSIGCCDHSSIARNGTTFSGRSMKYVFHCNQHLNHEGDDYLTPTQRAQRQVKKLKYMLHQAKKGLDQKDSEILKLTKEVVELRLHKANLDCSNIDGESKKIETKKSESPEDISFTDSGHFDDGTNSSQHSKDLIFDDINSPSYSKSVETFSKSFTTKIEGSETHEKYLESNNLIMEYEKKIQDLVKSHDEEVYNLKQTQNVKVEELLQRISEINSRYLQLVPDLEAGKEQIQNLEYQLEEAGKKLQEQENSAKTTYLKMYAQGQEAARQERENSIMELARHHPSRVTVPELLQELEVTKNELENIKAMYRQLMEARSKNKIDPEITLQFLKSAVYYFLTDKENSQGHLKAIESILGYTPKEISNIDKARNS